MDARYTGEQIAAARRAKGLTQKQLADALGVTDKAVSKWERGLNYPDIVLFQPISELLGLPLLQLFCKDGLSAEQAVAAAAALSAQEKQAVRRDMKWHAGIPPGGRPDAVRCAGLCFPRAGSARHLRLAAGVYHGNAAFHRLACGRRCFYASADKKALTGWKNAKRPGAVAPGLLVSAAPDYVFARDASSS